MTTNVTLIHNDTIRVHLKGTQLYTHIFKVLKLMMTGYHNDQSFKLVYHQSHRTPWLFATCCMFASKRNFTSTVRRILVILFFFSLFFSYTHLHIYNALHAYPLGKCAPNSLPRATTGPINKIISFTFVFVLCWSNNFTSHSECPWR